MDTKMYMLTETSPFMMSFVLLTKNGNVIIVDGGRPEDMPLLKEYVAGRHISAWILTHAHHDHITGFIEEMKKNRCADFDIEKVYYNFPDHKKLLQVENVPCREYFLNDINECLPEFEEIEPLFADKAHKVQQGETLIVDELKIEFLYTVHDRLYSNPMNDSSLVFKVTSPKKSVLFLGDLGPDGGDVLYSESRDKLKADIVQMAHHGHMNVSMEVYASIEPKACLWCAPQWLYDEEEIPSYLANREALREMGRIRMYGTAVTRRWMEQLGVNEHYITANGTQEINL
ncbi:MAG: MBL fold metallo-hydrolase [Clostridia bacterium]|nr:MBL fold metallo-hydrolase [Clostridia bacterium]